MDILIAAFSLFWIPIGLVLVGWLLERAGVDVDLENNRIRRDR